LETVKVLIDQLANAEKFSTHFGEFRKIMDYPTRNNISSYSDLIEAKRFFSNLMPDATKDRLRFRTYEACEGFDNLILHKGRLTDKLTGN